MTRTFIRNKVSRFFVVLALVLVAAVACGAAGAEKKASKTAKGPVEPVTYDPRVSLAPLVEKVSPAVVNIRTQVDTPQMPGMLGPDSLFEWFFGPREKRQPFLTPEPEESLRAVGSGFIIDPSGLLVTNHHVIEGADKIEVQLTDDRVFEVELVGSDERTDLALLRIKKAKDLPFVSFGESSQLRVGDHVIAIGNPFGLDHTVTSGIVSAKERVIGAGPYDDFIQTDASINPGNSGGPLFNLRGEVVGINTAIAPRGQGIGFAIPSDLAKGLIDSLRKSGKVVRGWLGISFQPMTDDLAKAFRVKSGKGAVVANVMPDSPAEKGGMKAGDIIVVVNEVELSSARQLPHLVASIRPGTIAPFVVIREGKRETLTIKIGEMDVEVATGTAQPGKKSETTAGELGFRVTPLDDTARSRLRAEEVKQGVVVSNIKPGSPASGILRPGDIIVEVNREKVSGVSDFEKKIEKNKKGDRLLLLIYRSRVWTFVVLSI
ncbi:MAG: DegQ family serine endoprotease [Deltaproteobacteria bacterium]|nr:DegQ family serine endoprotease [Deltaproteobacteria bacterium]